MLLELVPESLDLALASGEVQAICDELTQPVEVMNSPKVRIVFRHMLIVDQVMEPQVRL